MPARPTNSRVDSTTGNNARPPAHSAESASQQGAPIRNLTAIPRDPAARHHHFDGLIASHAANGANNEILMALLTAEQAVEGVCRENQMLRTLNYALSAALTEATQRSCEAHHRASHDALTGLPNRMLLMQRLHDGIADAFVRQQKLTLMFIDLDGFKIVNDQFGHGVGDKLLTIVASRLKSCVRSDDVACRFGGDEFVVMLPNVGDEAIAASIAETIRTTIDGRYCIDDQEVQISASIGLALYPADGEHGAALLQSADASMYRRKSERSQLSSPVVVPHRALAEH